MVDTKLPDHSMPSTRTYSCAVIGLGRIGCSYDLNPPHQRPTSTHCGAYELHPQTTLVAACDTDPAKREACSAMHDHVHVYGSAEEMFENHAIDIVSIAAPTHTHARLCHVALDCGIRAILCEKPFVDNLESGLDVIRRARELDAVITVNHWMRWSTLYKQIRTLIQTKRLRDVTHLRCHYSKGLFNSGTHAIDLLQFLFGPISAVQATGHLALDLEDDNIASTLQMRTGYSATLSISDYRADFAFELELQCHSGTLLLRNERPLIQPHAIDVSKLADGGDPFFDAVQDLVHHLDGHTCIDLHTCADAWSAVHVAHRIAESWRLGGATLSVERPSIIDELSKQRA